MKKILLLFFLFSGVFSIAQGQSKSPIENVVITKLRIKAQLSHEKRQ